MENIEVQLENQDSVIRKYLLDWLDDAAVEKIDEKIIREPEFFDRVLLVEQELLADLVAGKLSGEEKARAEQVYRLPINRDKLAFAVALHQIKVKNPSDEQPPAAAKKEDISSST